MYGREIYFQFFIAFPPLQCHESYFICFCGEIKFLFWLQEVINICFLALTLSPSLSQEIWTPQRSSEALSSISSSNINTRNRIYLKNLFCYLFSLLSIYNSECSQRNRKLHRIMHGECVRIFLFENCNFSSLHSYSKLVSFNGCEHRINSNWNPDINQ